LILFKKNLPAVRVVVATALCFLAPFVPTKQTRGDPGSPQKDKVYQRSTDPSLYVGSEACQSCHEDTPTKGFYKNYEASPHFVTTLDTKKGRNGTDARHVTVQAKSTWKAAGTRRRFSHSRMRVQEKSAQDASIVTNMARNIAITEGLPTYKIT
jgi:hypothetical protein